jgi:hypothetical protein
MPRLKLLNHPARLRAMAAGEPTFDPGHGCYMGHKAHRFTKAPCACVGCNAARPPRASKADAKVTHRASAGKRAMNTAADKRIRKLA